MELQHVNVKLFVENAKDADLEALIPVFHRWIQNQVCEELLIDVADYRHVHQGPGILLVGHQANYGLDHTGGRWGLRYNRKAAIEGTNQDRLRQATLAALNAYQRLDSEPELKGKFALTGGALEIFVNDRLLAPNSDETFATLKPELETFLQKLFGGNGFALEHDPNPRQLFSVTVKASRTLSPDELLKHLR